MRLLAFGCAVYGGYAFGKHRIADYLFLRTAFVFFDFEQPPTQFFTEYLAMMGLFVFLAYYTTKIIVKHRSLAKERTRIKEART